MKIHYFGLMFLSFLISAIYSEAQTIDKTKSNSKNYKHYSPSVKLQKQKTSSCLRKKEKDPKEIPIVEKKRKKKEIRHARDLPMPPPMPPEAPPDMPPDMPPPLPPNIPAPPSIGVASKKPSNKASQKKVARRKKKKKSDHADLPMPPPQPMPPPPTVGAKAGKSSSGSSLKEHARKKKKSKGIRMARRKKKAKRGVMRDLPLPPPGR